MKDKKKQIRFSEHELNVIDVLKGGEDFSSYVRRKAMEDYGRIPGEDLQAGDPVYVGADGKLYKAK